MELNLQRVFYGILHFSNVKIKYFHPVHQFVSLYYKIQDPEIAETPDKTIDFLTFLAPTKDARCKTSTQNPTQEYSASADSHLSPRSGRYLLTVPHDTPFLPLISPSTISMVSIATRTTFPTRSTM